MFTVYETQFGDVAVDHETNQAMRPARLFDPPLIGRLVPETGEIVWSDEPATAFSSIMDNSPRVGVEMKIMSGHRQDSQYPKVSPAVCPPSNNVLFWWNHWSEFEALVHTSAVCYVAVQET